MVGFDPSRFTAPAAKPLPVILLLDVSGSMSGEKIRNLNAAVKDMLDTFRDSRSGEVEIHVAIITFGEQVTLHQPLAAADAITWHGLSASGGTPLGCALEMAKAIIEDKDVVPSRAYRPTVVLVSDGQPTDNWQAPLRDFVGAGRSSKCERMAMAIGADANADVLGQFHGGPPNELFYAENATQLRDFFKFVTMSVTIRTKSQRPNDAPPPGDIDAKPATIQQRPKASPPQPGPSSVDKVSTEKPHDEGYW